MASSSLLFLFSIAFAFILGSNAATLAKPRAFILPIYKDKATLQYYTNIKMGNPGMHTNVVIDLGAQFLWFGCDGNYTSSSYHPVACGSAKCEAAKGIGCLGCFGPVRPGCTNNTCSIFPFNPFNQSLISGGLSEDELVVDSTNGVKSLLRTNVPSFPFSCADPPVLDGLAAGTQGMIGLARGQIALPKQFSLKFKVPNKFALCIPSSTPDSGLGDIFIGGGPYLSKSLTFTPLLINPVSTAPVFSEGEASEEYFINVKSIEVEGKTVSLKTSLLSIDKKGVGGTKISTIDPYTVLHSSIYKPLVQEFANKAAAMKITRVASVAPFGLCFSSKTIENSGTGPTVPAIDLVLESSRVTWKIFGHNSMVKLNKNVMCLGVVDGGSKPRTSIVIGGHQLEDNLLKFDLVSSKLGFSSSLLLKNTSCSHFRAF
ncbi:hypothetical protein CRYUN_Cryun10bG0045400 [Craigia yunnanensis]